MSFSSSIRSGLITGAVLLFLILIGIYGVFEALTLSGVLLTIQGATATEISQQVPTSTNPQFSRILTALIALIVGAVVARNSKSVVNAVLNAAIANGIAGAMMAIFLLVMNTLSANKIDVSFVFEKLKPAALQALLFNQPALAGALLWVAVMVGFGIVGALLLMLWRMLHLNQAISRTASATRLESDRVRLGALAVAAALLLIAPLFIGVYWNQVLGSIGLYVLLGLGLNIVVGFAGLLDLGYVGFYAIGAYMIAVLTAPAFPFQWGFWLALPLAMIAAAIAGTLLGIPVLRLRGDYLAIVTLGFGEIIRILFKFNPVTGGPQGILNVAPPTIKIPFTDFAITFGSSTPFWYLIFFACLIV